MGGSGDRVRHRRITYEPLPSQRRFHDSAARFKGFSGPIGSGKSQALCQEAIKLAYLNPGLTGLIGAPTYPMLRDATQATLFQILDGSGLPYEHNKAENVLVMRDTGSRILFRPVDDFERLRGTNLAWFGLDELTYSPEEAWLRLVGRLREPRASRLCGFAVWTPKGFDWVYRMFLAAPADGYTAIVAKANENRFLLEKIPDFYERLRGTYDERFYRQEVLGEYLSLGGSRVYGAFERQSHVGEVIRADHLPLLWALDFNVNPMCSVVAQIDRGRVRVLDEIVMSYATTAEVCAEFLRRFPSHPAGVAVYGDASGNHLHTVTGTSDYQEMASYFRRDGMTVSWKTVKSNPTVRDRVTLVNAKFKTADGRCEMLVDPRCRELILDLEQVSYKADSMQVDKDRDRKRTHLSDALGYLVWQECRPRGYAGERRGRLF